MCKFHCGLSCDWGVRDKSWSHGRRDAHNAVDLVCSKYAPVEAVRWVRDSEAFATRWSVCSVGRGAGNGFKSCLSIADSVGLLNPRLIKQAVTGEERK